MRKVMWRTVYLATLALFGLGSVAIAQDTIRVRGTIDRVEGPIYVVKLRDGTESKISLAENGLVVAIVKASLADIKQGSFVGTTGMPQPDGSQKAIEVHIFPEAMRGTGEGHYPWDLQPQSTMTNANVDQTVGRRRTGVDTELQGWREEDHRHASNYDRYLCSGRQERPQARSKNLRCRCEKASGRFLTGTPYQLWEGRAHATDVNATVQVQYLRTPSPGRLLGLLLRTTSAQSIKLVWNTLSVCGVKG